ncbi:DUF6153 family protein [Streptomyces flaveus]|uniref:DUF6153 family protein n=1 Tax=Streptomyces flaveus TaxID=66370 RepID=UPI001C709030|nr:DUF6153 family protein [Streptomyces flaveus]
MSAVTARAQLHRAPSPLKWWPTLLVLGLLAGLFGMHGLAPSGATAVGGHHSRATTHADRAMATPSTESVCHGDGQGNGHAQHADPTCASGAVGAGPALPVLMPDPAGQAGPSVGSLRSVAAEPEGGRAPPSLAELQLLRI